MKNSDFTDDQVTGWRRYIDKYLLLSWKTVLIIAGVWVLSVVLHKAMYGPFSDYFVPKDGLADNEVSAILQDRKGDLWFGVGGGDREGAGVSRYDGAMWQTFTTNDGLAHNEIRSVLQDTDGNLWFGTSRGVGLYDGASLQTFTTRDGMVNDEITSVLQDTDGNLWFGSYGGVSRYDGTSWQTFRTKIGLVPNAVFILGTVVIPLYFLISLVYTVLRKMKHDQYLLLSWKTLLIIPAWVLSVVLGIVILFFLFNEGFERAAGDEAAFFITAIFVFVIPLFFIISVVYTVIRKVVKPVRNRTS